MESEGMSEGSHLRWEACGDAPVGVGDIFHLAADLDLSNGTEHSQRIRLGRLLDSIRERRYGNLRVETLGHYQRARRYRLSWVPGGSAD